MLENKSHKIFRIELFFIPGICNICSIWISILPSLFKLVYLQFTILRKLYSLMNNKMRNKISTQQRKH